MSTSFDRITHRADVLARRAPFEELRISVAHIVNLVANGMTKEQIIADLLNLRAEDIRQALGTPAALAKDELRALRA
jgi:uncharacterized protein (DUF433 family)